MLPGEFTSSGDSGIDNQESAHDTVSAVLSYHEPLDRNQAPVMWSSRVLGKTTSDPVDKRYVITIPQIA
jgi:hypothetical protein